MKNTFKKGLILGGLLAAGAVVGVAMSKKGQELTEELKKDLSTLSKHLKKNLNKLEDVTKESFDAGVASVVEEYAKKKKLASDAKRALIKALQANWQEMEKEYNAGNKEEKSKK